MSHSSGELEPGFSNDTQSEIETLESGYTAYYKSLIEDLGRTSIAGGHLSLYRQELVQNQANLLFLQGFSALLPHWVRKPTVQGSLPQAQFELSGENDYFLYRQLQANTLWGNEWGAKGAVDPPYFIAGKSTPKQLKDRLVGKRDYVTLLLLPATEDSVSGSQQDASATFAPVLVDVRNDDMKVRDEAVVALEGKEFTDDDLTEVVDPASGNLILRSGLYHNLSFGGIRVRSPATVFDGLNTYKKATPETLRYYGVRYFDPMLSEQHVEILKDGVSLEIMTDLQIYQYVAQLALGFGVAKKVSALLDSSTE